MNLSLKNYLQGAKRTCGFFLNSTHFSTLMITAVVAASALLFANITPASLTEAPPYHGRAGLSGVAEYADQNAKKIAAKEQEAKEQEQATTDERDDHEELALVGVTPPAWPEDYRRHEGELRAGETLHDALQQVRINGSDRAGVIKALDGLLDFRSLRPRDQYLAVFDPTDRLLEYRYQSGPLDVYRVWRNGSDRFEAEKMSVTVERRTKKIEGQVNSSLFAAFQPAGEQPRLVYRFAEIFASRMDFNVETRQGDSFELVFEKYYRDDEFVGYGPILYARYRQVGGDTLEAFRYAPADAQASYFDADGHELGSSFLRSPVPMARVSSGFNRRRMHPILNEVRPHLAVDLAAPQGTPVMATADGRVSFRARDGGNGNIVILEHANGYRSYYAHLSGFKSGLKVGDRVRQRDIIGYVGATGLATGPHVCYRIRHNGEFINPLALEFKPRSVLADAELALFRQHTGEISLLARELDRREQGFLARLVTVDPDQSLTLL